MILIWNGSDAKRQRPAERSRMAQATNFHNKSAVSTHIRQTTGSTETTNLWDKSQAYTVRISAEHDEIYLTTIVTAYFNLHSTAKHSADAYSEWVASFYGNVNNAMVIFTDRQTIKQIEVLRAGRPTVFYVYDDLWALPKLAPASEIYKSSQHAKDPENAIHVPELYFIWNSKFFMANKTAAENVFHSQYFAWVDSGAFRDSHHLRNWPDERQVTSLFEGNEGRVLLGLILDMPLEDVETWSESMGPYPNVIIEGGFFAGRKESIMWYASEFYRVHDVDIQNGYFVGKDQSLMNQVALMHPDRFVLLDTTAVSETCSNHWFYFEQALANENERNDDCAEPVLQRWD